MMTETPVMDSSALLAIEHLRALTVSQVDLGLEGILPPGSILRVTS